MSYKESLLSKEQAALVVRNFRFTLEEACRRLSVRSKGDVGILYPDRGLFSRIEGLVDEYGIEIVGTVLEIKRHSLNITDPSLYYEPSNTALGQAYDDYQEEWVNNVIYELYEMANEMQEQLEAEAKEEDEGETREKAKATKQEIEQDYKRERKRLQSLLSRRKKAGVDVSDIEIPGIPKKVTAGSIRRLQKLAQKIKTAFRYLSGGRYRGMK